jgi:hypothetical protein
MGVIDSQTKHLALALVMGSAGIPINELAYQDSQGTEPAGLVPAGFFCASVAHGFTQKVTRQQYSTASEATG